MSCTCTSGGGNTGVPFCSTKQGVPYSLILVPKYKEDGTLNSIDLANDTLNAAYFEGKINEANWQDRWYPLPYMENVETSREDSQNETANSGNVYRIKQGIRPFSAEIFEQSPTFLGKLEEWLCKDFGFFEVDNNGTLAGTLSADGTKLYPRYVLKGSFDPKYQMPTDTTVSKVTIMYQYAPSVKDSEIGLITSANQGDAEILTLNGLLDVEFRNAAATTSAITVDVVSSYGDAMTPNIIEGLVAADFTVINVTDSGATETVTVVESPDGTYTLTFDSAVVASDELRVTVAKTGLGSNSFTVVAA